MYFNQILDEHCGCASYVIASRKTHEAAVIDPAIEAEQYQALLRERDFHLRYVIDTHIHADHVSGACRLTAQSRADFDLTRIVFLLMTNPCKNISGRQLELRPTESNLCLRSLQRR